MSEIINHIRRTCFARDYQFTLIRTNSTGEFNLSIGVSDYDGVITIRNAASPKLVEHLQNRGIPVVAIAHDYFPLDVPIVGSNNAKGMDLAFDHLYANQHRRITFIGDLSQYDLRKRFERFCELLDNHDLQLTDKSLVCVGDSLFTGGREAAVKMHQFVDQVDAVICGAGHTGMGFIQQMSALGVQVPKELEVVSFDDVAFMKVTTPKMPRIDQNLDVVAGRAIETLEMLITQQPLSSHTIYVEPTLITEYSEANESHWENRIHELDGLNNLNYVDSLINNSFELTHKILDSDLSKLMSLSPLFQQHMQLACLSQLKKDKFNRTRLAILKVFENCPSDDHSPLTFEELIPVESFPGRVFKEIYGSNHPTLVHFPLFMKKQLWGFVSVFGDPDASAYPTSFAGFTGYMDTITNAYSLLLTQVEDEDPEEVVTTTNKDPLHHTHPYIKWDLETGTFVWNDNALERLGFITDLERSIYRHMDIFDRLHPEDEYNLRKAITLSLSNLQKMNTLARFKIGQGGYSQFRLEGEVAERRDDRAVIYQCRISQIN